MAANKPSPPKDAEGAQPANEGFAITPSDGADLAFICRGIYVGVSGDIALITGGGTTLTFLAVPQGTILPVRAARVKTTGTTATNLIGLY